MRVSLIMYYINHNSQIFVRVSE